MKKLFIKYLITFVAISYSTFALANKTPLTCNDIQGQWYTVGDPGKWNFTVYQVHFHTNFSNDPRVLTNGYIGFDTQYTGSCTSGEGCVSTDQLSGTCLENSENNTVSVMLNSSKKDTIMFATLQDKSHLLIDTMKITLPSFSGSGHTSTLTK